ncbi:MAG TPA: mechanosensitive ion channel domain-containing protein [Syntrophorhabdaceae bacterium]|nr:mechanosensitive ion channel domain-containing protein [Syntrophorhabdaceae bacterium]
MLLIRGVVIKLLRKWMNKTGARVNEIIIRVFKVPSIFWCVVIGLYIGIEISELPRRYMLYVDKAISVILIFSITIALANLLVRIFEHSMQKSDIPVPATGIVFGVFRGAIIVAGMLVIFNVLGISITPLITALGIGGLAVALALKDTLSNLFSGLHIIASKEIRPGDYIKLDSGEEGTIQDITWRSTSIASPGLNIIIVPNAKVAAATVTNFARPVSNVIFSVQIALPSTADFGKVEKIALETARRITHEIPTSVISYEPAVRFDALTETGLRCTVLLKARDWESHFSIKHEFLKALLKRFADEGILAPVKSGG